MPEETNKPTDRPTVLGPQTQGASQFVITSTPLEFLVTFGHSRLVMEQGGGGGGIVPEWFTTLSLSPVAAKQLAKGLTQAVTAYEESTKQPILELGVPPSAAAH